MIRSAQINSRKHQQTFLSKKVKCSHPASWCCAAYKCTSPCASALPWAGTAPGWTPARGSWASRTPEVLSFKCVRCPSAGSSCQGSGCSDWAFGCLGGDWSLSHSREVQGRIWTKLRIPLCIFWRWMSWQPFPVTWETQTSCFREGVLNYVQQTQALPYGLFHGCMKLINKYAQYIRKRVIWYVGLLIQPKCA